MPFCCNVVSLYSAVTHAILAYGCNETYCSILELFVYWTLVFSASCTHLRIRPCYWTLVFSAHTSGLGLVTGLLCSVRPVLSGSVSLIQPQNHPDLVSVCVCCSALVLSSGVSLCLLFCSYHLVSVCVCYSALVSVCLSVFVALCI